MSCVFVQITSHNTSRSPETNTSGNCSPLRMVSDPRKRAQEESDVAKESISEESSMVRETFEKWVLGT